MAAQFRLYIDLGNDAMQTPQEIANVLRDLAFELQDADELPSSKTLRDDNGNTVGRAYQS